MCDHYDGFRDMPPVELAPAKVPMTIILGIIAELRAAGFVAGIAGGYARDLYYGATPKDVDVVISMAGGLDDADAFGRSELISKQLYGFGYTSKIVSAYMQHEDAELNESEANRRLSCVLVSQGADFIFYANGDTVADITDQFDFNVNQFALNDNGLPIYLGQIPHPDVRLVNIRSVLPERQAYIETKHKELLKCLAKKLA